MPSNTRMERCISWECDVLIFCAPEQADRRPAVRVQILDAFSLQTATGYTHDPNGRVLLETHPSLAVGRHWSMGKAVQLIRNDVRPRRWVALQRDRRAWALFWAGGGLQRCRELLADQQSETELSPVDVPVTAESLLKLLLDPEGSSPAGSRRRREPAPGPFNWPGSTRNPWKLVMLTSSVWMVVLALCVGALLGMLERKDRSLERLLKPVTPTAPAAPPPAKGR